VKAGERFGMIKFGSRLDLFLPQDVEIKVELGQKVKAGETVIGIFKK
jgi:phosphatidylserine decarboxylase